MSQAKARNTLSQFSRISQQASHVLTQLLSAVAQTDRLLRTLFGDKEPPAIVRAHNNLGSSLQNLAEDFTSCGVPSQQLAQQVAASIASLDAAVGSKRRRATNAGADEGKEVIAMERPQSQGDTAAKPGPGNEQARITCADLTLDIIRTALADLKALVGKLQKRCMQAVVDQGRQIMRSVTQRGFNKRGGARVQPAATATEV